MHPLSGDLSSLKDNEIENKIQDLTRKYFMTHNFELQQQISNVLNDYKEEMTKRRQTALSKLMKSADKSLDNLVKVN
jgi:vacuolar-type H+-ATPase subunit E/Vma4